MVGSGLARIEGKEVSGSGLTRLKGSSKKLGSQLAQFLFILILMYFGNGMKCRKSNFREI